MLKFALKLVKRDMAKVLAYANNNQNNQNQNQNNNQVRMVTSFGQRES